MGILIHLKTIFITKHCAEVHTGFSWWCCHVNKSWPPGVRGSAQCAVQQRLSVSKARLRGSRPTAGRCINIRASSVRARRSIIKPSPKCRALPDRRRLPLLVETRLATRLITVRISDQCSRALYEIIAPLVSHTSPLSARLPRHYRWHDANMATIELPH